jgi:hypothetical protein
MLDRSKVIKQLQSLSQKHFVTFADDLKIMQKTWERIAVDKSLAQRCGEKTWKFLVPHWSGLIGFKKNIVQSLSKYSVCAVDGSQIYYDKHQGMPCHVLNIGTVGLRYGYGGKAVYLNSEPHVFVSEREGDTQADETINLKRELFELRQLLGYSQINIQELKDSENYVALSDGSLLFFYVDVKNKKIKTEFFDRYIDILMLMHQEKISIVGYISFPKSKELIHVLRLAIADFDEHVALSLQLLDSLVDTDVAQLFLETGERTRLFQTRTSLIDLYPEVLKPYFCYLNVGPEIVRLEFPAWVAQNEKHVDHLCAIIFDQAAKGRGYPVCLFEAHEQAVIKGAERSFFYQMLKNCMQTNRINYTVSQKQIRKQKPCI